MRSFILIAAVIAVVAFKSVLGVAFPWLLLAAVVATVVLYGLTWKEGWSYDMGLALALAGVTTLVCGLCSNRFWASTCVVVAGLAIALVLWFKKGNRKAALSAFIATGIALMLVALTPLGYRDVPWAFYAYLDLLAWGIAVGAGIIYFTSKADDHRQTFMDWLDCTWGGAKLGSRNNWVPLTHISYFCALTIAVLLLGMPSTWLDVDASVNRIKHPVSYASSVADKAFEKAGGVHAKFHRLVFGEELPQPKEQVEKPAEAKGEQGYQPLKPRYVKGWKVHALWVVEFCLMVISIAVGFSDDLKELFLDPFRRHSQHAATASATGEPPVAQAAGTIANPQQPGYTGHFMINFLTETIFKLPELWARIRTGKTRP